MDPISLTVHSSMIDRFILLEVFLNAFSLLMCFSTSLTNYYPSTLRIGLI